MSYKKEQRLDIGRQIYTGELTREEAMKKYGICKSGAEAYVTAYKRENGIPFNSRKSTQDVKVITKAVSDGDLEMYQSMTKEELIQALIISKANELRAKKGYEVKGVGQEKEFISLSNKNSK